jgi:CBS domain-containing protein
MDVRDIMTSDPVSVPGSTRLDAALQRMADEDVRHLPVVEGDRLVGVVSDRDLLAVIGWLPDPERARARAPSPVCVADVMHREPVTVGPGDTVVTAAVEFVLDRIGCLPVLDGGRLTGIVTEMDMLVAYWRACRSGLLQGDVDPPVSRLMSPKARTIGSQTTLEEALQFERSIHVRHLPVVDGGRVVGMISDRDLRAAEGDDMPDNTPVEQIMSRAVVTVGPDEPLSRAAHLMGTNKFSALPVVAAGELVGIVTLTNVLDHCIDNLREPEGRGQL